LGTAAKVKTCIGGADYWLRSVHDELLKLDHRSHMNIKVFSTRQTCIA
jgi:hypothetical protein